MLVITGALQTGYPRSYRRATAEDNRPRLQLGETVIVTGSAFHTSPYKGSFALLDKVLEMH
jgi:hypothetical protein